MTRRGVLRRSGALVGGIAVGTQVTAAARTDRYIVQTRGNRSLDDVDVVHELPGVKFAVVRAEEDELEDSKAVKDYAVDTEMVLNDPEPNAEVPAFDADEYEGQPGDSLQWDKDDLNVSEALEVTEGEGSRVTIIDSGILSGHPDLDVNEGLSRNFTDDGGDFNPVGGDDHGTHVAGIVAANNEAGLGVNGTAPETDLVACRVFSAEGGAAFGDILAAIVYSVAIDADAANLSLGAYPVPRQELGSFYGNVLNSVMTYANAEGTLLVIAAGNDPADLQRDRNLVSLPAEGAQGLAVSATGPVGYGWDAADWGGPAPPQSPAFYTNYGTNALTLGAPGGDASQTVIEQMAANEDDDPDNDEPVPDNWFYDLVFNTVFTYEDTDGDDEPDTQVPGYGWKAGTSMAAPQVTGAVALVKSVVPEMNPDQVESLLKRTADVPEDYEKPYYGGGYLDVVSAVEEADGDGDGGNGTDGNNGNRNGRGN
ncbi:MAG: S8 family serine peptidase [Halosimplex sp.]